MEKGFTHIDGSGKACMVNVGDKNVQIRRAVASGRIRMLNETVRAIEQNSLKKGDVLTVARVAGIQAAKSTPALIPLCHQINLDSVGFEFVMEEDSVFVRCTVQCMGKTGVEMEALSGVSVALLTIYDMCKGVDKGMCMEDICLEKKTKEDLKT